MLANLSVGQIHPIAHFCIAHEPRLRLIFTFLNDQKNKNKERYFVICETFKVQILVSAHKILFEYSHTRSFTHYL